MPYSELTQRYFQQAPHAGVLQGAGVGHGSAGSRTAGTWVRFDVQVVDQHVTAARFHAYACPHVIAIASWLCDQAAGQRALETLPEAPTAIQRRFGVPVEKLGRLLLVEDAWIAAIRAAVTKSGSVLN